MTVPAVSRLAGPFIGNGVTTVFPFTFQVNVATEIVARTVTASGVVADLVLNSTFSVTLNPDQQASPGGTVTTTTPVATGTNLFLIGNTAQSQPLDLPSGGNFSALSIENQLDRMAMMIQELQDRVGSSLRGSATENLSNLPAAAARAGGYLGFDSVTGAPVVLTPTPTTLSAVSNILPDTTLIRTLGSSGQRWGSVFTDVLNVSGAATFSSTVAGRVAGAGGLIGFTASVNTPSANQMTITLPPCVIDFRSTTVTDGSITQVVVPTALTLVVPAGATLGTSNGVAARLWVLAVNNAGTAELCVYGAAGGANLNEAGVSNVVLISASATDGATIYGNFARTLLAYRVIGYIDVTQTTAGQWASAITRAVAAGGQFAKFSQALGSNEQTWQSVTGSRAKTTVYTNTTGRPICVSALFSAGAIGDRLELQSPSGVVASFSCSAYAGGATLSINAIIPVGGTYRIIDIVGTSNLSVWAELR